MHNHPCHADHLPSLRRVAGQIRRKRPWQGHKRGCLVKARLLANYSRSEGEPYADRG